MLVEIWADIICPWCGLGNFRLDRALAEFAHADEVDVVYRSFQLNPSFPLGEVRDAREMLKARHGMTDEQITASNERIEEMAHSEGLVPYSVGANVVGSTALAHEMLAYASERGKGDVAWRRMYKANFGEVRPIFDVASLVELGKDVGLDSDELATALAERTYQASVEFDMAEASNLGATGVPFIVIDRAYAVAGAQPTELLVSALKTAWDASTAAAR